MSNLCDNYGIVYILVNECMPGLVKIGKTSRKDMAARLRELYTTGVPLPFECRYACRVKLSHMDELEKALHQAFAPNRVNLSREFFRVDVDQVLPILKLMTHMNEGDATAEVSDEIQQELKADDVAALAKQRARRPPIDYFAMGMKKGDELVFNADPSVRVVVAESKKVSYEGVVQSLTAVTKKLLKKDYDIQPTPYWSFNGDNLANIYDRCFPPFSESAHQLTLFEF